jgi:thiamine biosynthesis lipoprotein
MRPWPLRTVGAGFLAVLLLGGGTACRSVRSVALQRYEFTSPQMGVPFRIVLYATNAAAAGVAADAAFTRVGELNGIMSDYDDDSELSRLSRSSGTGRWVRVSDDLWRVLVCAQEFARRSGGAFDITVGPYVNLWRRARREHQLPSAPWLARARQSVGYELVELDAPRHSVRLVAPNMRLDLGGIAKGYAAQEALKTLQRRGYDRVLVAAAGDIAVGEAPPGKPGWRVEVAPIDVTNAPPARFVLLRRRAVSTSGDLFQRLEIDGKRYSHIVDPRTGIGLTDHSLVTTIAPTGMVADALCKVISVLGPAAGLRVVETEPGAAAFVVRQPGERLEERQSKRFARFLAPAGANQ